MSSKNIKSGVYFLNLKFYTASSLLWLYSLVPVRPDWKPER